MKTTVQELKELYAKLGGTADLSNVQTDSGMIDAIDSVAGGGGSLSPATADTLGGVKIGSGISVTEDGTISASGGGSSEPLVCKNGSEHLDTTFGNIYEAYMSGRAVVFRGNTQEGDDYAGSYGSLIDMMISGSSDDGYSATLTFSGSMFAVDFAGTIGALFAKYPSITD